QLLSPLDANTWAQVPVETLGWLPADFVVALDEATRAVIDERAEAVGGVGALAAAAEENGDLPPFFTLLARQPLLGGTRLCGPEDISPELVSSIGSFLPDVFNALPPAALMRLTPEALAALPPAYVDDLPDDLRDELDALAASAGGLGAGGNGAASGSSPAMPSTW